MLTERFISFIDREKLRAPWLLAVSGGLDSVVLTDLSVRAGIECSIAHCNFHLRGAESDRDEAFVRELAAHYKLDIHVAHFDLSNQEHSVQEAARELRYAWFGTFGIKIATAHHQDDNIETLLMNFVKGTGVSGLRGMLPARDGIVHPLLFARREELEAYAAERGLTHVEDSSNVTDKYNRNFIRHRVIPLLEERYPDVRQNLGDNLARFRDLEVLYRQAVQVHLDELLEPRGEGEWGISLAKLARTQPLHTVLYELTKPYGFSAAQVDDIASLMHSSPGHYVASRTYRIIRDRKVLILCPLKGESVAQVIVEEGDAQVDFPCGRLSATVAAAGTAPGTAPRAAPGTPPGTAPGTVVASPDPLVAYLDASQVSYPLMLRRWKPGDYFYPLGMRKKKKLARFFIDAKLSMADKEKTWVLESGGRIHWVLGRRIDDRSKVLPSTQRILRLEWLPG